MKKIISTLIIILVLVGGVSAQDLSIVSSNSEQSVVLKDGFYYSSNGNLYTGSYIAYFESGNKKSKFDVLNGKANGAVTYFYENGKVMETGVFASNEKQGEWLRWDDMGNKIAQAFYNNGKKDGLWLVWDAKGLKRFEMNYASGEKTGKWLMWNEEGVLTSEKSYSAL